MDYTTISKTVGKIGTIRLGGGVLVDVEILNHKNSYGNDRWLVKPVAGSGEMWVESVTVKK